MKQKYIADLQFKDRLADEMFAVKNLKMGKTVDGRDYADLILSDRTGEVTAKVWNECLETCKLPAVGDVAFVTGTVEEFRDKQQVKVTSIRAAKDDEFELEDYLPKSERDSDEMWQIVESYVAMVKDKHLKELLNVFFSDKKFIKKFKRAPAAEMIHHAYLGGLLEHTSEMLQFSESITKVYKNVNRDLLTVGILLHDIGKIDELGVDHSIYRTTGGCLVGHIVQGANLVSKTIGELEKFPEDLGSEVIHLILSHHGKLEYGSPVRPMTIEAMALHNLDMMSFELNTVEKILQDNKESESEFSDYNRLFETRIYLK